jgi:hypothetical protein
MNDVNEEWKRYQDTAARILNEVADHFGLKRVEGQQSVPGLQSGTEWEIDAKGCLEENEAFVIVEARRYTSSKLKQEQLGALAYRITDTGAVGGIVVTPLGLQEGAQRIAKAEKITSVLLNADATPEQFAIEFLGNLIVRPGSAEVQTAVSSVTVVITTDGKIG